jgi:class 3 adenylate cyclase
MSLKDQIITSVNEALDDAEKIWKEVGHHFVNERLEKAFSAMAEAEKVPSKIPGFPFVQEGEPQVADFIALILDIRNSTQHLLQAISAKIAKASQLERVLYETTAINTAGSIIVDYYKGGITEYLGDGFLALYRVKDTKNPAEVYDAYNSAKFYLSTALNEINTILNNRYSLPNLEIGIGLAYSKAIVTIVGHGKNLHPKALGECVYRASKLSKGVNEIFIDERLELLWPKADDGTLKFILLNKGYDFKSYRIWKS